jgi:hypothetical protein
MWHVMTSIRSYSVCAAHLHHGVVAICNHIHQQLCHALDLGSGGVSRWCGLGIKRRVRCKLQFCVLALEMVLLSDFPVWINLCVYYCREGLLGSVKLGTHLLLYCCGYAGLKTISLSSLVSGRRIFVITSTFCRKYCTACGVTMLSAVKGNLAIKAWWSVCHPVVSCTATSLLLDRLSYQGLNLL